MKTLFRIGAAVLATGSTMLIGNAAVFVDTSPGTGAPPGQLGGYQMASFPADSSPEYTLVSSLAPPALSPVAGTLNFDSDLDHLKVGSGWDTWSHSYPAGDVYFNADHDLMMDLPTGTLAFYLYVQPNLKYLFEFKADSMATTTTLMIDGAAGAQYVGFYTDSVTDPLSWIYVRQTTGASDGFVVGEFGINSVVPEPSTYLAGFMTLAAFGLSLWRSRK